MTDQAPVKREARPIDTVRVALEKMKPQLAMALPRHLTADRLLRVAVTAVQNVPKLLECDRTSLYAAIMACAQLGLEPDGILGQAYLVPFAGKVQLIPGYKGLITLARNSGDVTGIVAHEVYSNDVFGHWNERTRSHQLNMASPEPPEHLLPEDGDRGELKCFYAIARFKDSGCAWDVMTRAEVETIRDRSSGYKSAVAVAAKYKKPINSPWASDFAEMGKKTAIRRIAKYLPLSVQKAAALADSYDTGRHTTIDEHGEILIAPEAGDAADNAKDVTQAGSKLERFEAEHGGDDISDEMPSDAPETIPEASNVGTNALQEDGARADVVTTAVQPRVFTIPDAPDPSLENGWKGWLEAVEQIIGLARDMTELSSIGGALEGFAQARAKVLPSIALKTARQAIQARRKELER